MVRVQLRWFCRVLYWWAIAVGLCLGRPLGTKLPSFASSGFEAGSMAPRNEIRLVDPLQLNRAGAPQPGTHHGPTLFNFLQSSTSENIYIPSLSAPTTAVFNSAYVGYYRLVTLIANSVPGAVYNLYSRASCQVNGAINQMEDSGVMYMSAVGAKIAHDVLLTVVSLPLAGRMVVYVDNVLLDSFKGKKTGGVDDQGNQWMVHKKKIPSKLPSDHLVEAVVISLPGDVEVTIYQEDNMQGPSLFVFVEMKQTGAPQDAHGILGQFHSQLEGSIHDYEVRTLFADDFKFNRYAMSPHKADYDHQAQILKDVRAAFQSQYQTFLRAVDVPMYVQKKPKNRAVVPLPANLIEFAQVM